jgi:tetratricopeptide (TPR) repeat protein
MTLPPDISENLDRLSEEGNAMSEEAKYDAAIAKWAEALDLIPEPKSDWEASTWLYASIADSYYQQSMFEDAQAACYDALNASGGQSNPFIHYRLGQCKVKLGNISGGVQHLLRAYMLDGREIFAKDEGGSEFLDLLLKRRLI